MKLTIPIKPLAISKAYQGRRFMTPEYRKWVEDVLWLTKGTRGVSGAITMRVKWHMKRASACDIDNPLKTLLDTLKKANIIEDDRMIWKLEVEKIKSDEEKIDIEISVIK